MVLTENVFLWLQEILRQQAAEDADCLNHILLEVERLWPPILGGRRLTLEVKLSNVEHVVRD